jgi:hypothetical protein
MGKGKEEEQPQIVEGRYRCEESYQFLLKFLALNIEGEKTLSYRETLERITKLEEENPGFLVYGGSERRLDRDLEDLGVLKLIKVERSTRVQRRSEITISELGRYFAALFMTPDALKPVPEVGE